MITHPLLATGLLLLGAYWGGRAANLVKLPRVSGYLVAGILLSPSLTPVFAQRLIDHDLHTVTEIALGLIAYTVGGSLVFKRIKHLGRSILWITVTQAWGAFLFTTGILLLTLPFFYLPRWSGGPVVEHLSSAGAGHGRDRGRHGPRRGTGHRQ